ncbi:MAG TPA: septum formation initiator family protein [Clostridiales bacterium]|nr:septum formation initiator family protein [Clostridiales bacterium]
MPVKEIKIEKPKHKKKSKLRIIISLALSVFVIYAVVTLITQQVQISQKTNELSGIRDKIVIQEVKNDEISAVYNSGEDENAEYIEKLARENLDFAYKGERIFINIAGE